MGREGPRDHRVDPRLQCLGAGPGSRQKFRGRHLATLQSFAQSHDIVSTKGVVTERMKSLLGHHRGHCPVRCQLSLIIWSATLGSLSS